MSEAREGKINDEGEYLGFGTDFDALDAWRLRNDFMWAMCDKRSAVWRSGHLDDLARGIFASFEEYSADAGGFTDDDTWITRFIPTADEKDYSLLRYAMFFVFLVHHEPYLAWVSAGAQDERKFNKIADVERFKWFVTYKVTDAIQRMLSHTQDPQTKEYSNIDSFARFCISEYSFDVGFCMPPYLEKLSREKIARFDEEIATMQLENSLDPQVNKNAESNRKGLAPPPIFQQ